MTLLSTDKIDFKINLTTGDLDLTGGRLNLSSGITGVAQGAYIRVKQVKGEWFFNTQRGVPYFEVRGTVSPIDALLGQRLDKVKFERALRDVLETSPGVERVLLFAVTENRITRRVGSRWQLRTAFGDTPIATLVH